MTAANHLPGRGRGRRWAAVVAACLLACGCKKEEGVRTYEPPAEVKPPPASPPAEVKERIVGVIAPNGNGPGWYFFKMRGPADQVAGQLPAFESWVASVRFVKLDNQATVIWDTPSGWTEGRGDAFRMAVFKSGAAEKLDISVAEARGSLLDNVNRWRRDQLGLPEVGAGELDALLQWRKLNGRDAFAVDLAGPGGKKNAMTPPFAHPK
jgi:hypothetical protein